MKLKSVLIPLSILGMGLLLTACSSGNTTKSASSTSSTEKATTEKSTAASSDEVDLNSLELPQLDAELKENESAVEIETTAGNIKLKLFPEIAPKAVENFMTHAKEGYYDGVIFHRVVEDFMIQGGDPDGTGAGGESIWGEPFETEISEQLYHIRGALSMAKTQEPVSIGSQFFIVQNTQDVSDGLLNNYYPKAIIDAYKNGGVPQLDGGYTVFGQVYEGMDTVDKIAKAEVKANSSGEESTPLDPVKIKSIKILQEAK
ncbi:peptidylprolyl isomerase [Enterococcus sp. JM4C]|uniref:peptidylprolyl isomerase n=1 Tax=Candidatus Enterococcus huntleyi TaxID=1857217 RepID=UPI0013794024|nr:peptidylprolyl isomerase [Enterococcus sp. JM4C]KAF1296604.1 peptidylprolyl isomerase [Enterococcus sp. JM4C]